MPERPPIIKFHILEGGFEVCEELLEDAIKFNILINNNNYNSYTAQINLNLVAVFIFKFKFILNVEIRLRYRRCIFCSTFSFWLQNKS